MSIVPQFTIRSLSEDLQNAINNDVNKFIESLSYIGEDFVNKARSSGEYNDITGNLRSSIGYYIINNGSIHSIDVNYASDESRQDVDLFINDSVNDQPSIGIYLIVFAGMEYARYVESKGYDVITGSTPTEQSVLSNLLELI